jgi:cobalt-zinc-cadmium efflux system protein
MIIPRAWSLLQDVVDVLLEAIPRSVDLDEARGHLERRAGAVSARDRRPGLLAQGHSGEVQDKRGECLGAHFDVEPLHLPARTGTPQGTRGRGRTTEATPGYSR